MSDSALVVVALVLVGLIEGGNGLAFALRAKRTLSSVGLSYHEDPGLVIQEFGVYSLAIASTYLFAVVDPLRRPGVLVAGIIINGAAACMHLARSLGIYFGGAMPKRVPVERISGPRSRFSLAVLGAAVTRE